MADSLDTRDPLLKAMDRAEARRSAAEIERLRKALDRIGGMAGDPDPVRGCRNICAVVRETLSQ